MKKSNKQNKRLITILRSFPKLTKKQQIESDSHTKATEKAALYGLKHLS